MKHEKETLRSEIMRSVHSKGTKPELVIRKIVRSLGYKSKNNDKGMPGKPDIVIINKNKVIFINGCFWHGHKCTRGNRIPIHNREYWITKITRNKLRDRQNYMKTRRLGIKLLIIWECQIKNKKLILTKIKDFLRS